MADNQDLEETKLMDACNICGWMGYRTGTPVTRYDIAKGEAHGQ